jgi:hypothetical protein
MMCVFTQPCLSPILCFLPLFTCFSKNIGGPFPG